MVYPSRASVRSRVDCHVQVCPAVESVQSGLTVCRCRVPVPQTPAHEPHSGVLAQSDGLLSVAGVATELVAPDTGSLLQPAAAEPGVAAVILQLSQADNCAQRHHR